MGHLHYPFAAPISQLVHAIVSFNNVFPYITSNYFTSEPFECLELYPITVVVTKQLVL